MRTTLISIFVGIIVFSTHHSYAQSPVIDVAIGQFNAVDRIYADDGMNWGDGEEWNDLGLNVKASYLIPSLGISPVIHWLYYFQWHFTQPYLKAGGSVLDIGIQKTIPWGHAQFTPSLSLGYNWEQLEAHILSPDLNTSFANNGVAYLAGFSLILPFLKGADAVLGYTFIFISHKPIDGTLAGTNYEIQSPGAHHLFTFGISLKCLHQEEKE